MALPPGRPHSLVIHELPMLVDLVFHREVDRGTMHVLTKEHLHLGLVLFILEVADHVGEPDNQAVVAARERAEP